MSIIDTIMSALRSLTGGGTDESTTTSGSTGSRSDGQVSVEHEPDSEPASPDASTEAAVKGGDADAGVADDAAAAGTDATASTGTLVDEDAGKEPAEAVAEAGSGDGDADEGDAAAEGDDGTEADDAGAATESVETITGIGPAYAGRLEGIGIETVGELAAADAAEVAEGIDVSETRVSDWIERANDAS
ncbi:helix-hairpin-helix domain-containing protein [Halobellus ruber]|uniref:Helix-hairpin-helix domain-containing protein n=1 Tax=Halobellus ruber TaxID=2761102 RepID=A0A7J9SHY2_9EURY|nr:helix-hairpin-helix domain-containing protein [Halobellus ruber]MBB6646328.1 helix-hairpin-helix domain-containing protein [Halobellus ruber]